VNEQARIVRELEVGCCVCEGEGTVTDGWLYFSRSAKNSCVDVLNVQIFIRIRITVGDNCSFSYFTKLYRLLRLCSVKWEMIRWLQVTRIMFSVLRRKRSKLSWSIPRYYLTIRMELLCKAQDNWFHHPRRYRCSNNRSDSILCYKSYINYLISLVIRRLSILLVVRGLTMK
jgi:hypothetical protein